MTLAARAIALEGIGFSPRLVAIQGFYTAEQLPVELAIAIQGTAGVQFALELLTPLTLQLAIQGLAGVHFSFVSPHSQDSDPEPPVALPSLSPVYRPYAEYGYILLTAGQKTLRVLDARVVEQSLATFSIYAERLRFINGTVLYRVPSRFLSRCQRDRKGYFLAWGGGRWDILAIEPPLTGSYGIWQPV